MVSQVSHLLNRICLELALRQLCVGVMSRGADNSALWCDCADLWRETGARCNSSYSS